jgi:catecholate siderophore receptor
MAELRAFSKTSDRFWPVTCRWLAAGTLAVYSAIGCQKILAAQVPARGAATEVPSTRPVEVRRFDIPAGLLSDVLPAFETAAGIHVEMASPAMGQLASPGVTGVYTAPQALDQIAKGTGLRARFTGSQTVLLELIPVVSGVEVSATIDALATSMPKYNAPLVDTPQTVSVVPQEVIQEQNATTLRDTLRNVAGISLAAGEGGSQGDNLTIRGFTARNDLFIDGMRDFGSYYRDPFNLQEVEVLQGPSSVTFGRGSTGGVVNQATKTPGMDRFFSAEIDGGTDLTRRLTADMNLPVSGLGPGAGFRLNIMGDEGNVAGRNAAENRRFGVAPSLALGLGTPTRLTFSYIHQDEDDVPDYGLPWLFNGAAPVNRNNYYGFSGANFLRTYDDIGTVKAEHDFGSRFTLRNQMRYAHYLRDAQITEPQIIAPVTLSTPLSSVLINRNEISVNSLESLLDEQLDFTAKFDTGPLHHSVATGVEASREKSDPTRLAYTNVPTTSLLNPNPDQPFTGYSVRQSSLVDTTANSTSAYLLDTISIGRHWDVTGGIRWDRFSAHYTQGVAPATAFNRIDEMPSWKTALVYKPVAAGSIYFAAGDSFNPSAESLSLSAANASLPPEKNTTYEAGTKWNLSQNRLSLRTAVFRTTKTNAREPDPNNPLLNVLASDQRVNGVEFETTARVIKGWEARGSYAHLDGTVLSSNYYPASVGAQLANVPHNTLNIWNTWRLPGHWEAGLGGNYVSSRTASSTVPLDPITGLVKQVPGYWVFNAMLEYPLNEHIHLQANAYNLANRYYYDELHPGHIVLGPGRSLLIGLKFRF